MIFLSRFIPVWSGVIVQSVIFALLHIDKSVLTGFFALIAFFLWYKTKSIIPSMILHSLYNIHGGLVTFYNFDFVPRCKLDKVKEWFYLLSYQKNDSRNFITVIFPLLSNGITYAAKLKKNRVVKLK